jgi:hypothetical protein
VAEKFLQEEKKQIYPCASILAMKINIKLGGNLCIWNAYTDQ